MDQLVISVWFDNTIGDGVINLLEQFKGFIGYTEDEFKDLWEKATFVVDTNVLLNFYKYTSKDSTASLLAILKKIKDAGRLWIPHQIALEYFFNHENNMKKQKEVYEQIGSGSLINNEKTSFKLLFS